MQCPNCGSTNYSKAGYTKRTKPTPHKIQQYQCAKCFRTFPGEVVQSSNPETQKAVAGTPDQSPLSIQESDLPPNKSTICNQEQTVKPKEIEPPQCQ